MVDGYEYQSAITLNSQALPYPGKRPWPNPLDPTDGGFDFDGDGLTLSQESKLWKYTGSVFPVDQYNDGTQNSGGRMYVTNSSQLPLDEDGNGILTDDERDADGDNLSNIVEYNFEGTQAYWKKAYAADGTYSIASFSDVDDGADDQDHDGWSNFEEMQLTRADTGYRVHAFNPCLPDPYSRVCSRYAYLSTSWAPFNGSQQAGDMIPFRVPNVPGTMPSNTWNGNGGPQN